MKKKKKIMWFVFLTIAALFLTVGYATVTPTSLAINGTGTMAANGNIYIESITLYEKSSDVTVESFNKYDNSFDFSVSVTMGQGQSTGSQDRYIIYEVTIYNDSIYAYRFGAEVFSPEKHDYPPNGSTLTSTYEVLDLTYGDEILAKHRVTFHVKLSLSPSGNAGKYTTSINSVIQVENVDNGIITAVIDGNNTGNLTSGNTLACFSIKALNSHLDNRTFDLTIKNTNFNIVNQSGNSLSTFTINAESTDVPYNFCIKKNDASQLFPTSPQRVNIYMVLQDSTEINIGTVILNVDVNQAMTDHEPPTIGNINIVKGNTTKTLAVSWSGSDNVAIEKYDVELYNTSSSVAIASKTDLTRDDTSWTFGNNLNNGQYYVKVIAYDSKNSTTKTSSTASYSWTYTVTASCTNSSCTANPSSATVQAGGSISISFSGANTYSVNSVSMVDSSTNTTNNSPTYTFNNNTFSINNITGNVTVSVTGTTNGNDTPCLIKGTKVLLADGTTKNIEDIYYNDLIMVYSHETGEFVPEYPIWIESGKHTDSYQLNTFSDGTTLKTKGKHTVFSVDDNEFVDVTDSAKYHIGTTIIKVEKIDNQYKLKEVTVTNIETIYEDTMYYDIVSTRYYNAITDDVLTSDGRPELPNFYLFKENILWSDRRQEVLENNIQVPYELVSYMPYYLYMGLRAMDGAVLVHYGYMTYDDFYNLFESLLMNPIMQLPPQTNDNGNRVWMATNSLDNVTDENRDDFLIEEGEYYTLPCDDNVEKWYSPSNNEYYECGDQVQIWHGMHFIAILKSN